MSDKERLQLEDECLMKYSKAQMIEKYINELEENSKLSELWCKSQQENKQLKEEKRKVRDYINKHCVNEKISKEVGYKCYTMADTNELEKIMKILGDKRNEKINGLE